MVVQRGAKFGGARRRSPVQIGSYRKRMPRAVRQTAGARKGSVSLCGGTMKKPRLLSWTSFKKLLFGEPGYKSKTAPQYVITRGKSKGEIVSKAGRTTRVLGKHPNKLAELRKEGKLGYGREGKLGTSERTIPKAVETLRRFSRRGTWRHPNEVTGTHPFLSKEGAEQRAAFKGRDLAVMQTYREDVHGRYDAKREQTLPGALQTGYGGDLAKYDRMKIYDIGGNRVYPETDVKKLRRWWNGKSVRARNNFESELFYTANRAEAA
jgi:hypothetical protein